MEIHLFFLVLLQLLISLASSCSTADNTRRLGMEQTFYDAPAVVIATDIFHSLPTDGEKVEPEDNYAIFAVDCIMKSGGYTIGRNISIYEGAVRYDSMCHTTFPEVGTKYVIGLQMYPSMSNDSFFIYEPNPLTAGGFEATDEILQAAVKVCGLQDVQAVGTGSSVEVLCPLPKEDEVCFTGAGTRLAVSLISLSLSIAVFWVGL